MSAKTHGKSLVESYLLLYRGTRQVVVMHSMRTKKTSILTNHEGDLKMHGANGTAAWPVDLLYPIFAEGYGYAISRKFNECAQTVFKSMESYWPPLGEDVTTGIAAHE